MESHMAALAKLKGANGGGNAKSVKIKFVRGRKKPPAPEGTSGLG
jgi:hypothetical protein